MLTSKSNYMVATFYSVLLQWHLAVITSSWLCIQVELTLL